MLHVLDADLCVRRAGRSFAEGLGYEAHEVIGRHVTDFLTPESAEWLRTRALPRLEATGSTRNHRYTFIRKDGSTFPGMVSATGGLDSGIGRHVSVIIDTTELEAALATIEWQTGFLERSQAMAQIGHWRVTLSEMILLWSDELFRIHGLNPADGQITHSQAIDFYHPEDRDRVRGTVIDAVRTGQGFEYDARIIRADGQIRYVHVSGSVQVDEAGSALSVFGVLMDVTSQKRADRSRLLMEKAIDSASESFAFIRQDGTCSYVNEEACISTGYSREELFGKNILDIDIGQGDNFSRTWEIVKRAGVVSVETTHRRKDGTTFPVEVLSEFIEFDGEAYICVRGRNIEVRRREEAELILAKEQAEASVLARDQFLAMMSHEIRTPMNGVIGMTSLLSESELDPPQRECVEIIHSSGSHLLRIINDILDFSKVDAGKIDYELHAFRPRQCLSDGIVLLAAEAKAKGLDLSVSFDKDLPDWIKSDPTRIRQIVVNLAGNAVKFTDSGGIWVKVWSENATDETATLRIEVSDSGIGIPQDRVDHLFEPFTQLDASTTRRFGGTGLGLAICKRLCEGMGGSIEVASKEGEGTVFTLSLPVATVDAPETAEPEIGPMDAPTGDLKILLAEDNPVNQRVAMRMLHKMGYQADCVGNGLEVLDALKRGQYDVILMDVRMPEMDGLTATAHIRSQSGRQPHIIAITANATASDDRACRTAGMNDYVSKPIDYSDLEASLRRVVR
jgi:PAS domain S-box-containing protein